MPSTCNSACIGVGIPRQPLTCATFSVPCNGIRTVFGAAGFWGSRVLRTLEPAHAIYAARPAPTGDVELGAALMSHKLESPGSVPVSPTTLNPMSEMNEQGSVLPAQGLGQRVQD